MAVDRRNVHEIQRRIEQALRQVPDFSKIRKNIVLSVTGEGLRIELLESEQGMFFVPGSPAPTTAAERLLQALANELARMPNPLVIEDQIDALPFRNIGPASTYGNWELAVDRANQARRLLQQSGVRPEQITEVRGFADHRPLNLKSPNDPRNRRISVVVRFQDSGT